MQENCQVFTSLIQQIRNSRKLFKMRRDSWKFRCQQQFLARSEDAKSTRKPAAFWIIVRHNTHASWKPTNLQECAWKDLFIKIMKIMLQEKNEFIESLQFCTQNYSCTSSNENTKCKSSGGQRMGKLEKIPAWQLTKVRNKKEVIDEARKEGKTVHFASLMDLCHLKNLELQPKIPKYKGREVFRGDTVKDDSGSYAAFTEQDSSASQMTTAKVIDVIARLPGCAGQAADEVSACTQVKVEEDAHKLLKIPKSECPDIWIRLPRHKWPKSWSRMEDPSRSS